MELGRFLISAQDESISYILSRMISDEIISVHQVCERYGLEEDEVRYYDVYEVECTSGKRVLKQTDAKEVFNYET